MSRLYCFFFFNDTATTEIYTLSLHDALPISRHCPDLPAPFQRKRLCDQTPIGDSSLQMSHRADFEMPHFPSASADATGARDRKSTRLNSSHGYISYAVFCLKKKKTHNQPRRS